MRLPDKKRPGDPVLASDWNVLLDAIASRTPRPSPGMELVFSSGGFSYRRRRAAQSGGGTNCRAFFATEVRDVNDEPHLFLVTGQVMGGSGNQTPEIDLGAVDSPPENDQFVWLEITGDGLVEDEVLMPGFTVTDAAVGSGPTMPDNTFPTASQPTAKKVHVLLGEWTDQVFKAVQCGHIQVSFCPPETYKIERT